MRILVTGCAGFIGSHSTERLLADGHQVVGVDSLSEYYDPSHKVANMAGFVDHDDFHFVEADLVDPTLDLAVLLANVERVLHLAGQPGVRASWATGFDAYVERNVLATQRLLEAATDADLERVAAASSSSVYGDAETYPTTETELPRPVSPYGVTKLAAEHLCSLYATNFGVHTVSLRYFTVYGPRQRPDMALRRMIDATLRGEVFPLFGDGSVSRSFTYVGDVVDANMAALFHEVPAGSVCNIANESTATMTELIDLVGDAVGTAVEVDRQPVAAGDARRTGGSSALARELLGWSPTTPLIDGVGSQVAWSRSVLDGAT